jgi:hypothetical protein
MKTSNLKRGFGCVSRSRCTGAMIAIAIAVGNMLISPSTAHAQASRDVRACAAHAAKITPILKAKAHHQDHIKPMIAFSLERPNDEAGHYQMALACMYDGRRLDFDLLKSPDAPATAADRDVFLRASVALGMGREAVTRLLMQCEEQRRATNAHTQDVDGDKRSMLTCSAEGWTLRFYP